jgi:hypothetical protein
MTVKTGGRKPVLPTAEQVHDVTAPEAAALVKPAEPEKSAEAPTFNWDELEEDLPQEYTRGVVISTRDLEKETPDAIKSRVQASFDAYMEAFNKAVPNVDEATNAEIKKGQALAVKASTRVTPAGSEAAGNAFLKLAKAYGKFRGMTVRGAVNPQNKAQVVWRAKPEETRERKTA